MKMNRINKQVMRFFIKEGIKKYYNIVNIKYKKTLIFRSKIYGVLTHKNIPAISLEDAKHCFIYKKHIESHQNPYKH